jgi:hypothetical protein
MVSLPKTFGSVIAEEPYDDMGREFQLSFGAWIDSTSARRDGGTPAHFQILAFQLFRRRLALAQKYRTFFATQVVQGDRELWRERYTGTSDGHCYSFAIRGLPRTKRFFEWCTESPTPANDARTWDLTIKPLPLLPMAPHFYHETMPVWAHRHHPRFRARREGSFSVRRIEMGPDVHLIEHFDNRWVPNLRQEAAEYWFRANDTSRPLVRRVGDLAAFEWIWFWTNPFGRAGALTGDSLSLLTQKQMVEDGESLYIRPGYYHQDCEAFLMGFEAYTEKRSRDMTQGFVPRFSMDVRTLTVTKPVR